MSLYTGEQLTIEEAKAYNKKISEWRMKSGSGCIETRACEHCGILVTDTICLCIGYFECPKCGKQNGTNYSTLPINSAFFLPDVRFPEQNTYYPYV